MGNGYEVRSRGMKGGQAEKEKWGRVSGKEDTSKQQSGREK